MSKEDVQKKASAAEAVLTLEAVSTVKGLVGPAVKPKKRAAAKETSSSAKRSGESEKRRRKPSAGPVLQVRVRAGKAFEPMRSYVLVIVRRKNLHFRKAHKRLKRLTMRIRCRYLKRMQTRRLRARGPLNCLICL